MPKYFQYKNLLLDFFFMKRYAWLKEVLWVCAMLCLRLRAVLWVVLWGCAMAAVPLSIESSIERGAWAGA
jgi:hypothetical protein